MDTIDLISEGIAGIFPSTEEKTKLTKEILCQKLAEVITPALDSELNCELFISNYILKLPTLKMGFVP